jgi:DNA-binding response OmpR family regulator
MVVDDDVEVRAAVADVLVMEGYEARPLPSADAAWSTLVAGARPAVIILDWWLPGMTSSEFVRRLRASAQAGVRVLLLSASESVDRAEIDADAVARKPIEPTSLVRAVDKLVGSYPGQPAASASRALPGRKPARRRGSRQTT